MYLGNAPETGSFAGITAHTSAITKSHKDSIAEIIDGLAKKGLSAYQISQELKISKNKINFIALQNKIPLVKKNILKKKSRTHEASVTKEQHCASPSAVSPETLSAEEKEILRDIMYRQGCSIESAARIMSMSTGRDISTDNIISFCEDISKNEQAKPSNPDVSAKTSFESSENTQIHTNKTKFLWQPPEPSKYRRVTLMERRNDQCHNIVGRNKMNEALYCGAERDYSRDYPYCVDCYGKLREVVVPKKKKRKTIEIARRYTTTPTNKWHAVAMSMRERGLLP